MANAWARVFAGQCARVRRNLGSIIVLPIVVIVWGSEWQIGGVELSHAWLLPVVWGVWFALLARAGSTASSQGLAQRILGSWQRVDAVVAALLIYAVLFRSPQSLGVPLLIWGVLAGGLHLLDRASGPLAVALITAGLVFGVLLPRAFQATLISRIAQTYDLSVDHRMKPDGGEINADGARFRQAAAELSDEDFVVLFLGDSFTFGFNLYYNDSYPYQLERIARESGCSATLRAVNFGWTSASPLLSLRLMREVGQAYRPDLLVYNLDMTDFHDDLRYERKLRAKGDFDFEQSALVRRLVMAELPWAAPLLPIFEAVNEQLRSEQGAAQSDVLMGLKIPGPEERYFITEYPLEKSRPGIERGVMKNLGELHRLARDVFAAQMALVVYPRAYQYSERESPRSWENSRHERLGPFSQEPFRYFEEVAGSLPYPVLSLLPAFQRTAEFPLFFEADPHWNEQGAALVARAVYRELSQQNLIPCPTH